MKSTKLLDSRIDVPCPQCGHKIAQTLRRLRDNPEITCPSCGVAFDCDGKAGVDQIVKAYEDGVEKFSRAIRDANRRLNRR